MMLFVDSTVIVYTLDGREPNKQQRCREWLKALATKRALILSPQVCGEARSAAVRKLKIRSDDVAEIIRGLLPWCRAPLTAAEIDHALHLAPRWQLSWWDAVLLASAKAAECTHFLTEDAQSAPELEGVRFVDPFKTAPEEILGAV